MKNTVIKLIELYHRNSGHLWLHSQFLVASNCKYFPSCSEYTAEAIKKYGLIAGLARGFFRILKCNPLSRGGVDIP